jgi:hypothetical protein
MRWCTRQLKIRPVERFVGDDPVISYIGIRGDEDRAGYISTKPNITPRYPFKEDGITERDVYRILDESGLGVPDYYQWRTRSGCYFCFFQRRDEWLGLADNHPKLFARAKQYEKNDPRTGRRFTWVQGMTLDEVVEQRDHIEAAAAAKSAKGSVSTWQNRLLEDADDQACLICTL